MHFHLPKPLHGWREFAGEVGIIVLGVLVALGFEQIAEEIHWSNAVRQAHAEIRAESKSANNFFEFRAAADRCIQRRLDSIGKVIENVAAHNQAGRIGTLGPDIGNGLSDSTWQAQRASQTLTHFEQKELDQLGLYYHQLDSVADAVFREDAAWSDLRVVEGDPSHLGPEDVAGLRRSLQHARFENYLISTISREQLGRASELNLPVASPDKARLTAVCAPLALQSAANVRFPPKADAILRSLRHG
jgi:hypothetical protein